jgi:hypothetical protein
LAIAYNNLISERNIVCICIVKHLGTLKSRFMLSRVHTRLCDDRNWKLKSCLFGSSPVKKWRNTPITQYSNVKFAKFVRLHARFGLPKCFTYRYCTSEDSTLSKRRVHNHARDPNSPSLDQELGALTKWLARWLLDWVSASFL